MNLKSNIYIFSVNSGANERVNFYNHEETTSKLTEMGISHKELLGSYNGIEEQSILIEGLQHKKLVESICKLYSRTYYLHSGPDRNSWLVYPDHEEYIGKLVEVSKEEAIISKSYTYDMSTDTYWIAKL